MSHSGRPPVPLATCGAALAALGLLLAPVARAAGDHGVAPPGVEPAGSWFGRLGGDIAHFRSYPHFERAYRLVRAGALGEASREFTAGLRLDPEAHRARLAQADVLQRLGEVQAAHQHLDALAALPDMRLAVLQRRLAWHRPEAPVDDATLDELVEHPQALVGERLQARRLRLARAIDAGEWALARADLDALPPAEIGFDERRWWARIWAATDEPARAMEELRRAAAAGTDRPAAQRAVVWRELALLARDVGDAPSEHAALLEWHRTLPKEVEALRGLRDHAVRRGRLGEALDWARRAVAAAGAGPDQESLGHLLYARRDAAGAARAFQQALTGATLPADEARLWRQLGHAQAAAGHPGLAARAFEASARRDGSPEAWRRAAQAHADAGDPARAAHLMATRVAPPRPADDERRLAQWAGLAGRAAAAAAHAEAAARLARQPAEQEAAWREAAHWHHRAGQADGSRRALKAVVALAPADLVARRALADACLAAGDAACARTELEQAQAQAPDLGAQRRLVEAEQRLGDLRRTERAWQTLAGWSGLPPGEAMQAHLQRAELLRALRDPDAAIQAYRDALAVAERSASTQPASGPAAGPGTDPAGVPRNALAAARVGLAHALLAAGRSSEALPVLRAAQAEDPSPGQALQILRTRAALGHVEEAEPDEQVALALLDRLAPDEQVELLRLVATRRSRPGHWDEAERLWHRLNELQPAAGTAVRLAQVQVQAGHPDAALATLQPWIDSAPQDAGPLLRQTRAQLHAQSGYALQAAGRDELAADQFDQALADRPDEWTWRRARALALGRAGRNEEASGELVRAIDEVTQVASASFSEVELWQMREHNRRLRQRLEFTAYESLRNRGSRGSGSATQSSGVVPSQGGLELLWQPPGVEPGPERVLQLTGRLFWSHRGSGLAIDSASTQGSVGLRFKPLGRWPAYVEAQRLVRIGAASRSDWLLRATAGWTDATVASDPARTQGNYSSVYGDLGYFTQAGRSALYVEARQGWTWRLDSGWLVSPHVVFDGRAERSDPDRVSYSEWGAGVSLRRAFNGSRHETPRSSAEVLLHYKRGIERAGSGWVLTVVLGI